MTHRLRGPDFEAVEAGDPAATAAALRQIWRLLTDLIRASDEHQTIQCTRLPLHERAVDPPDPVEGNCVIWMSDGTDAGDDGDLIVRITAGGATKLGTLADFSAL